MGRRKHDAPLNRFSTSEVAAGCGLSARNVMYLCSEGLIPIVSGGKGKGRHRQLEFEGLAQAAVIGAFYSAGIEIYLASRLVQEIGDETSFHNLTNLESFLSRTHSGVVATMHEENLDPENALHLHDALRRRSNNYQPHKGMPFDKLIEIFDRIFVFLNHLTRQDERDTLGASDMPVAMYRISGWQKGTDDVELVHAPPHRIRKLPAQWQRVRENFRGMTRVNVSLAIRDSLDAIAEARAA